MKYRKILKELSMKENFSMKEIEKEMKKAIKIAGLKCSVKDFIELGSAIISRDYI